jgi:hypothetical protein
MTVPTFATTPRFRRDLKALTPERRTRFEKIVCEEFVSDVDANLWRSGLQVKRVQSVPKMWEMDWEDWWAAPRGYDAAVLGGVSSQVSALADRVQREFQTDLQTRSGKLAQLLFSANVIRVNAKRADPSPLVEPAKRAAGVLLADLRAWHDGLFRDGGGLRAQQFPVGSYLVLVDA